VAGSRTSDSATMGLLANALGELDGGLALTEMDKDLQSLLPPDEDARLALLASYGLDYQSEKNLDDIVRLVVRLCDAPIAMITFVDEHRQWFKAKVGLSFGETPRQIAFCAHTVQSDAPLIVNDALRDPRFATNPLVIGSPYIRFYAGFPLVATTGSAVGTLAVMDTRARTLEPLAFQALQVMAAQVVNWLQLRRSLLDRDRVNAELQVAHSALKLEVERTANALARATSERDESERLYQTLWETTTDAVLVVNQDSVIRFASPSSLGLFQYRPEELVGNALALIQPERLRQGHEDGLRRYLRTHQRTVDWRATETLAVRKDGTETPVEIAFSQLELGGKPYFVGFFRDIAERKHADRMLFEEKERAQATLRSIGDGVIVVDEAGRISFLNPMAENLTGWSATEASGQDYDRVLDFVALEGERSELNGPLPDSPDTPAPLVGQSLLLQRRDGQTLSIEGTITQLRDRDGRGAGSVVAFRDVSKWRQLTALLSHQATHDALTGLVNRAELERRLQATIDSQDQGHVHSLLYLDLDQFKVVNDTSGHVAGDALLKELAQLLRGQLRDRDTLARLGGDEFGVLLEECPSAQALAIADKLRHAAAEFPFAWGKHFFNVGVSIGHVCFQSGETTMGEVLSKADEACYLAKDLGRNRVHSYQAGDEELARRHGEMEWVGPLRKALNEGRFVLYEQKIVDLVDDAAPPHFEILLRMRDEAGGLVPPMTFIPAAERYSLMPAIDRWVISAVVQALGTRIKADAGAVNSLYAINLSGGSITDARLSQFIRDQLAAHGVPGRCVCFEITETAAIGNLAHAVELMTDLKGLGCRFSLDDFGSGMSSFAYLKRLPIDFLKIDGVFVRDIAAYPVDRAMVSSIHQIGSLMGLKTIAEFVESEAILAQLRLMGVHYGQGFALGRPQPFQI